jgi:large subunit ribosomal protein L9
MKVILSSDILNLGEEGDVCTVAPGYARNYLLPKGLVMEHNARNLEIIESRRAEIDARREEKRATASGIKGRLEGEPLVIPVTAGTNGRLFGSVTSATIQEHLAKKGIEIERKHMEIPGNSIKATGTVRVRVRLYGGQEATLTVRVEAVNTQKEQAEERKAAAAAEVDAALAEAVEENQDPEVIAMAAVAADEDAEIEEAVTETEAASEEATTETEEAIPDASSEEESEKA